MSRVKINRVERARDLPSGMVEQVDFFYCEGGKEKRMVLPWAMVSNGELHEIDKETGEKKDISIELKNVMPPITFITRGKEE